MVDLPRLVRTPIQGDVVGGMLDTKDVDVDCFKDLEKGEP